jgi:hypothetical protein
MRVADDRGPSRRSFGDADLSLQNHTVFCLEHDPVHVTSSGKTIWALA